MQETQPERSREKNRSFFAANADYEAAVLKMDSYANIATAINAELTGIDRLIDVGNGGVFLYDASRVREIFAYDLFFEEAGTDLKPPRNAVLRAGSALDLPAPDGSADAVLMVMLLHHVIGDTVARTHGNLKRCLQEAARVLRPEGRLLIVESCVPGWLYRLEKIGFRLVRPIVEASLKHPMTFQYPRAVLEETLHGIFHDVRATEIPLGRHVIQLGFRFPVWLTPVRAWKLVASRKRTETLPPASHRERAD